MGIAGEILRRIALGGHGGGADTDAAGLGRRALVAGYAVLVQGDAAPVQTLLHLSAGQAGALLLLAAAVGGTGIWFAPVISEALCAVMAVWFLRRFLRKTAA